MSSFPNPHHHHKKPQFILLISLLILSSYLFSIYYRTFIISLNPRYFRDIDFHCYRKFSELLLLGGGDGHVDDATVNSTHNTHSSQQQDAINSQYWSIPQIAKSRNPYLSMQHASSDATTSPPNSHLRGGTRPSGIIAKLLSLFIQKPCIYLSQQIPSLQHYTNIVRSTLKRHLVLNYEYFICDYGPMYYPAAFVLLYAILVKCLSGSGGKMQQLHAWIHLITSTGSSLLFWEFYDLEMQLWMLLCAWASQTVYISGLGAISNDIWSGFMAVGMLIGIKYRWYSLASFMFAFSVAFKMNALLYGPALLVVYLVDLSLPSVVLHFFGMGLVQLALAAPFMLENFQGYVQVAYNFSRDFDHIENIKWTFLGDDIRHHELFYKFLLGNTVLLMTVFLIYQFRYLRFARDQVAIAEHSVSRNQKSNTADLASVPRSQYTKAKLFTMLGAHYIAFVFVRGLHIQFSLWIYFSIPFILQCIFLDHKRISRSRIGSIVSSAWNFLLIASYMLLYDFCISHPRRVLHLRAVVPMLNALFAGDISLFVSHLTGEDQSLFGKLGNYIPYAELVQDSQLMSKTYYNLVGHYYLEGFDAWTIPGAFILFLLECIVLVYIFKHVKRNEEQIHISLDRKVKVE